MADLGGKLFADDNWLSRLERSIPDKIGRWVTSWLMDDPGLDDGALSELLIKSLWLRPLWIGAAETITLRVASEEFRLKRPEAYGIGHLATARVPYDGSAILWKMSPHVGFNFALWGSVGENHARLQSMIEGLQDIMIFKEMVDERLAAVRVLLPQLEGLLIMFNKNLHNEVERGLEANLEERMGLRVRLRASQNERRVRS